MLSYKYHTSNNHLINNKNVLILSKWRVETILGSDILYNQMQLFFIIIIK